jgi:hypothetical protein
MSALLEGSNDGIKYRKPPAWSAAPSSMNGGNASGAVIVAIPRPIGVDIAVATMMPEGDIGQVWETEVSAALKHFAAIIAILPHSRNLD